MSYRSLASPNSQCAGAVAPTVYRGEATFAPGAVAGDIITGNAIPEGAPAVNHQLSISNPCCYPVTALITYQDGGDCEPCTTDEVTTVVVEFPIPAFTEWTQEFPGVSQQVDIRLEADIPADAAAGCTVSTFGISAADCPECLPRAVAAPAGVLPDDFGPTNVGESQIVDVGANDTPCPGGVYSIVPGSANNVAVAVADATTGTVKIAVAAAGPWSFDYIVTCPDGSVMGPVTAGGDGVTAPLLQTVVYNFTGTLGVDSWSGDGCGSWLVDGVNAFAASPTTNCSETINGLQDIADAMNALDPNGVTWVVSGSQITAQVDSTIAAQYGSLTTKDATQWTGTASIVRRREELTKG